MGASPVSRVVMVIPYNPLAERSGLQNCTTRFAAELRRMGTDTAIFSLGETGRRKGVPVIGTRSFPWLLYAVLKDSARVVHWVEVWPSRPQVWFQHLTSALLRLQGKRVFLSTATLGNLPARGGGPLGRFLFGFSYDGYIVYSHQFVAEYEGQGIRASRVRIVPQAVPLDGTYRPVRASDVRTLREKLRLPVDGLIVLYLVLQQHLFR